MPDNRVPPKFENAPGIVVRPRKKGFAAVWQARTDLVQRGFTPKSRRIAIVGAEPSKAERAFISDQCNLLQTEMLVWGRGGVPVVGVFDGTLATLIDCYLTDPDCNYPNLRLPTRKHYDYLCARLVKDHGTEAIADIKARHVKHWHEEWTPSGEAIAHALVGMLRTVLGFGRTFLEDDECERLSGVLSGMRFKMAKKREKFITAEQVIAVRRWCHARGCASIALAQAFQFDLMLRQKDVIGEWVPQSEPGLSDVLDGNNKWLRGIRWEEIDENLVLRHITSKRQKLIEFDLHNAPMVMEELVGFGRVLPTKGPVIVSRETELPYIAWEYRRQWRLSAREAGVPDDVFNMDSRSGAITEALLAGADMESVRHAAKHSNITTTQGYSRAEHQHTANVAKMRIAHANKTGTA